MLRNSPESIFSGGGGAGAALGLKPNQNIVVLADGTFACQSFAENVDTRNGSSGEARVRHFSNTEDARNSASAVLDSYMSTLSVSKWANNAANAGTVNSIDNAFATGRIYSVDGVNGGRFYTGAGETGNVFIGTQNSQGGFASGLEIAGLIAHEGTHVYQYARGLDPRVQLSEYAAHAAQYSVMKGMSSYTLTAQEMQSIDNGYNFAAANDYAAAQNRRSNSNVTDNAINADPVNGIFFDPNSSNNLNRNVIHTYYAATQSTTDTETNSNTMTEKEIDDQYNESAEPTGNTPRDSNWNSATFSTSTPEYIEPDAGSLFGDPNSQEARDAMYQKYLQEINDAKSQQTLSATEAETLRREQAREFFQTVEAERLMSEYDSIKNKSRLNITNRYSLLNNSQTNAAISRLREVSDMQFDGNKNENYETAIQQRNTMISTICEGNVNFDNIKQFRMYAVSSTGFERRASLENNQHAQFDGEITINNGRETVKKINMLGDLGVKFDTLMINAHGHLNVTYPDSNGGYGSGLYYGTRPAGLGQNAASWSDIRWEGIVNNGFSLYMGSCTGYDDAEAIIKIIKESNKDITGLTAYGRNYIGNWAGATANYWDKPNRDFLNQIWRNQTAPMGLVKYSQDANGNIVEETTFTHPANRYLFNAQNNRIWTHYRDYAEAARNISGANIRELNTILSRRGNQ